MPIAPVLTGGIPSGCGIFSAPELVCGGEGGGWGMMRLLFPAIGLAASAELAPRSTAAATKIGNVGFMTISLSRNVIQRGICASIRILHAAVGLWVGANGAKERPRG